jgi:hypothetical protein
MHVVLKAGRHAEQLRTGLFGKGLAAEFIS